MDDAPADVVRTPKGSTVGRALDILDAVARAERPLTPTELAAALELPKATVHRLCGTLEERGYLQTRLGGRGLQAGHRLNRLAAGVLASAPLQARRRAILEALSREIGETCNIAVPDGMEMVYYDRAETHWPVRVQLQIGSRVPAYATAGGKMYLSSLAPDVRARVVGRTALERHTANTIVEPEALHAELERTAARGHALDDEEYIEGMVALAVPVTDEQGRLYATLSFHAPCMRVPFERVTAFLPALQRAARDLSRLLEERPAVRAAPGSETR